MTKKFLAVTLVLVLAAGFAAVAQDEERPLTGEWENTLTLDMNQEAYYLDEYWVDGNAFYEEDPGTDSATKKTGVTNPFIFSSDLSVTYESGGLTYDLAADLDYDPAGMPSDGYPTTAASPAEPPWWQSNGLTDLEFGVSTSVGLLDLSSTVNFNPDSKDLDYWISSASLTLGGVSITDTFVLQPVMQTASYTAGWETPPANTQSPGDPVWEASDTLGAGMNLMFSGETPGGVSVTVENLFGMEKVEASGYFSSRYLTFWNPYYPAGHVTGTVFSSGVPYYTGYNIVTDHDPAKGDGTYGASSLQYVESIITLENMSLGCCDFSNETVFTEANGFEYTEFEFTIESTSLPISLDGYLKFTEQTKSIYLVPSISTDWACFTVYSGLIPDLGNNGYTESVLNGFEIRGFAIEDVELGHVKFSSYTALGDHTLNSMLNAYMFETGYDELFRIEKLEKYPLDFTLDTYFNMSGSSGIFDLALFAGSMEYEIDDEFTIGTGVELEPDAGLQEFSFTFDYSF